MRERSTGRGVKSDETLLAIVSHLRDADGAGVTELATALDLAKSTVHDHLSTMLDHGLVARHGDAYHLGLQFLDYGQYVRNRFSVYQAAQPAVDDLEDATGEMVWVLAYENGRVMYLYGRPGDTDVNVDSLVGSWAYVHCNSGGKAILAHRPESDVEFVVDRHGLPARTKNTITDADELHAELERVRERGFALNLGEDLEGIHAVGVPLEFEDDVRGALAIAGPAHRVTRERCESDLAEQLFAARDDVELNLVYS